MHRADGQTAALADAAEHARLLKVALVYLQRREPNMAAHVLRRSLELNPRDPFGRSYLGLCMAMVDRCSREALMLCEEALKTGCFDPILYCNLGKVHLLRGNRRKAHTAFASGLKADPHNRAILQELRKMGIRQKAWFSSLPRGHAANRFAGHIRRLLRRSGA
jgi:Flp pilus assembly protein TadD